MGTECIEAVCRVVTRIGGDPSSTRKGNLMPRP